MAPSKVVEGSVGGGKSGQILVSWSCPEAVLFRTMMSLLLCRDVIKLFVLRVGSCGPLLVLCRDVIKLFAFLVEICGRMEKETTEDGRFDAARDAIVRKAAAKPFMLRQDIVVFSLAGTNWRL